MLSISTTDLDLIPLKQFSHSQLEPRKRQLGPPVESNHMSKKYDM